MKQSSVDVIIPAYQPDQSFRKLLQLLKKQTYPIGHILIVNTEEQYWKEELLQGIEGAEVFHIEKKHFDHGATRDMAAGFSDADILVFLTQDALPYDQYLIEKLVEALDPPMVKAAYARQLPKPDCRIAEGCVRSFNYPEESAVHTIDDLKDLGVKTYFCSNVCAAYDHRLYTEMGGFTRPCIFNEDMLYAARIILLGYGVAYAADAKVLHSHNYSNLQQFKRNFDNGVSQAMHPEIFQTIRSGGEGLRLVRYVTRYLIRLGRAYLIPGFYIQCAFRLAGFSMGKHYRRLPSWMVRAFTMNRAFWTYQNPDAEEEDL
jgi:rhamnosyltransferase